MTNLLDEQLLKEAEALGILLPKYDTALNSSIEKISTGSLWGDWAFGGGFHHSRVNLIAGPEGSGKSTMAMLGAIQAKKKGLQIVLVDQEGGFNPMELRRSGLGEANKDYLMVRGESGEGIVAFCKKLLRRGGVYMVIDSLVTLVPNVDVEREDVEMTGTYAGRARLITNFLLEANSYIMAKDNCLVLITQYRDNQDASSAKYKPNNRAGGRQKDQSPSLAFDLFTPDLENDNANLKMRNPTVKNGQIIIHGRTWKCREWVNKREFFIHAIHHPTEGLLVNTAAEVFDISVAMGVFTNKIGEPFRKSIGGSGVYYDGKPIGVGRQKSIAYLRDPQHAEFVEGLHGAVTEAILNPALNLSQNGETE